MEGFGNSKCVGFSGDDCAIKIVVFAYQRLFRRRLCNKFGGIRLPANVLKHLSIIEADDLLPQDTMCFDPKDAVPNQPAATLLSQESCGGVQIHWVTYFIATDCLGRATQRRSNGLRTACFPAREHAKDTNAVW